MVLLALPSHIAFLVIIAEVLVGMRAVIARGCCQYRSPWLLLSAGNLALLRALPLRMGSIGLNVRLLILLLVRGASHHQSRSYGSCGGRQRHLIALQVFGTVDRQPTSILRLKLVLVGHGHRLENVHAHRALLLDDQPLIDAVIVEVMVARLEDLHELLLSNAVEAYGAVVNLDLRGLPSQSER